VEDVPEAVVHEDNDWGISLVDEDLGDAGKIERSVPCLSCRIFLSDTSIVPVLLMLHFWSIWIQIDLN